MKLKLLVLPALLLLIFHSGYSQQPDSLLSKIEQWKLKHLIKGLDIQVYLDAYYVGNIGGTIPTSHTYEFQTNSPYINEARVNMFDIQMNYNTSWSRMMAEFRLGDQPLLLTNSTAVWTSYLNQASLGFTFGKGFWIDFGYLDSQIGVESSMPINNLLSTCTVGTYYEPSSVLGGFFSYTTKDETWTMGAWAGNQFSLPDGKNIHVTYGLDVSYNPSDKLTVSFNNYMGNMAKSGASYYKYLAYNNLYVTYNPIPKWNFIGQADLAFQRVSSTEKDSVKLGAMVSGLLGTRYYFLPKFALALRAEVYYDPKDIFVHGQYTGKTSDFIIYGLTAGLEFNPGRDAYVRVQYSWLTTGNPEVKPFNEVFATNPAMHYWPDYMRQCYTITTGLRF
ncbi:MAG: outer membrane beta-barrel protein [Bacteroidetes bacterium]|nr:outer membrane beta-barrel protein [Bacteroidota bacterium]